MYVLDPSVPDVPVAKLLLASPSLESFLGYNHEEAKGTNIYK